MYSLWSYVSQLQFSWGGLMSHWKLKMVWFSCWFKPMETFLRAKSYSTKKVLNSCQVVLRWLVAKQRGMPRTACQRGRCSRPHLHRPHGKTRRGRRAVASGRAVDGHLEFGNFGKRVSYSQNSQIANFGNSGIFGNFGKDGVFLYNSRLFFW